MKRRRALIMFGMMMIVFIVLSGFSFVSSRGQVTPELVSFGPFRAIDGKRVFQAYNCMGCHTMVGNGAYFAPDLTKEYESAGPAWLAAFLPSAGGWPTEGAVRTQLMNKEIAADAGVSTIEAYYAKYPGARERIERRGGGTTYMPNLRFREGEVGQLIAYLKYTSAMNTEGWPPKVMTGSLGKRIVLSRGSAGVEAASATAKPAEPVAADPATRGANLAKEFGCIACHSADESRLVGPGWGKLYGSHVKLADGSTVTADDAYLTESILQPNAKVVAGFPAGTMPSYSGLLKDDDVKAIVEYIHILEKK
jgi:mono/diheme cytochrome c family protein